MTKIKILLIENDDILREDLFAGLSGAEYQLICVKNVAAALRILEDDIRLLILDPVQCEESADMLFRAVDFGGPNFDVIVHSRDRTEESIIKRLGEGVSDFLEKPVSTKLLAKTIEGVLRRQERAKSATGIIKTLQPATGWVELTAPSELECLRRIQRFSELLFASRLPNSICEDLRMIMEEVGRNAIEWGNQFSPDKSFRISYCIFNDRVVLKFEDEGEGFHPGKLPDPISDPAAHIKRRSAEGKRPGGYGVFLVQKLMDEVVYSERGNVVLMTKFLPE